MASRHLELQALDIGLRELFADVKNLDRNHAILRIKVENHARAHFLRIDHLRINQPQVQRVDGWVVMEFQSLPFIERSKYAVTINGGSIEAL